MPSFLMAFRTCGSWGSCFLSYLPNSLWPHLCINVQSQPSALLFFSAEHTTAVICDLRGIPNLIFLQSISSTCTNSLNYFSTYNFSYSVYYFSTYNFSYYSMCIYHPILSFLIMWVLSSRVLYVFFSIQHGVY